MSDYVTVREVWTREFGARQIGNGDWELLWHVDSGRPCPVVFFNPQSQWVHEERFIEPRAAQLLLAEKTA